MAKFTQHKTLHGRKMFESYINVLTICRRREDQQCQLSSKDHEIESS